MKFLPTLILSFLLPLSIYAQSARTSKVYTEDIDNFWIAFDSAHTTSDTVKQQRFIQKLYVDKGTAGLHAFMKVRDYNASLWVELINKYPKFWASIRPNTLQIKKQAKPIEASVKRFKKLYPEMRPASMYFTVGGLRSGGTTTADMVLVGTEIAAADQHTDASEIGDWLQGVFKAQNASNLVSLNIHEYVHTQQKEPGISVLSQCLKEGAADFVAELVTGIPNNTAYVTYGRQHESELKPTFKIDMFSNATSKWLYNGSESGQADLGYFMGYQLCKAYYQQQKDKSQALKSIIELDYADEQAIQTFLVGSKYYSDTINKSDLLSQFDALQPKIVSFSPSVDKQKGVSVKLTELTINFSEPMKKAVSITLGEGGKEHFPLTGILGFSEDQRSLKLKISLLPNKVYDFILKGRGFKSMNGYAMEDYHVHFETGNN
jgi:hypothetical protein